MTTIGIADWGPLVTPVDVDEAILDELKIWLPTYITRMRVERDLPASLPHPRFYGNTLETDELMDHPMPAVVVTTAKAIKTLGGPNYRYEATWEVAVTLIVRGRLPKETRKTASLMEGALRRCMLQKCRQNPTSRAGILNSTDWIETELAPVKDNSEGAGRYLAAGLGKYNVVTDAAVQGFGGPDVPDADSYVPLATVTDVEIDVESEE